MAAKIRLYHYTCKPPPGQPYPLLKYFYLCNRCRQSSYRLLALHFKVKDMSDKEERKDPFDGEYMGNIWGWRFSLIGLVLIVFLTGVIVYRHYVLDIPAGFEDPMEEQAPPQDTNTTDSLKTDE